MPLQTYYADLHVHLGGVKMAASLDLTPAGILAECLERKGLQVVGIIDASTGPGLRQLAELLAAGELHLLPGGGLRFRAGVTLLLGAEVEVWHPQTPTGGGPGQGAAGNSGPVHLLCYLPGWAELGDFAAWQRTQVKNPDLSTQRHQATAAEVVARVGALGGFVVPAHIFTPYKSLLAAAGAVSPAIPPELWRHVPAVELGLSADTDLAAALPELAPFRFVTNSDAHSRPKIAREYNALSMAAPDFDEVRLALSGRDGRGIVANYGLDPRLGKYHRSFCLVCDRRIDGDPPVLACPDHPQHRIVPGVLDRVRFLSRQQPIPDDVAAVKNTPRPHYVHQVPLQFVPGLGQRNLARLLSAFGTEMAVLHRADTAELAAVVGAALAERIDAARSGRMQVSVGAGGSYGRLLPES